MSGWRTPNLTCAAGHRFYAPNPKAWVGKTCGRADLHDARKHGCQEILARSDSRSANANATA